MYDSLFWSIYPPGLRHSGKGRSKDGAPLLCSNTAAPNLHAAIARQHRNTTAPEKYPVSIFAVPRPPDLSPMIQSFLQGERRHMRLRRRWAASICGQQPSKNQGSPKIKVLAKLAIARVYIYIICIFVSNNFIGRYSSDCFLAGISPPVSRRRTWPACPRAAARPCPCIGTEFWTAYSA